MKPPGTHRGAFLGGTRDLLGADALCRTIGNYPLDLDRMPPATSWCGDAPLIEALCNAVGRGDALLS